MAQPEFLNSAMEPREQRRKRLHEVIDDAVDRDLAVGVIFAPQGFGDELRAFAKGINALTARIAGMAGDPRVQKNEPQP